jgi:20S proteasome alpha/beta subunit
VYRGYDGKAKVGMRNEHFAEALRFDFRVAPRRDAEMTFTYAVIADGGVVLCADSQMVHVHSDQFGSVIGTYEGRRSKIRRIGRRFAYSICGNGGLVDTLLAEVNESDAETMEFDAMVTMYMTAFQKVLIEKYRDRNQVINARYLGVVFLFCGFVVRHGKQIPQVIKLDIANDFSWLPITGRDYASTGQESHGAAYYLHHRFYREGMPLEQAKLLAYCVAAEVADQDTNVGGPIEMEVITPSGSEAMTNLEKYESARKELLGRVRTSLAEFK